MTTLTKTYRKTKRTRYTLTRRTRTRIKPKLNGKEQQVIADHHAKQHDTNATT